MQGLQVAKNSERGRRSHVTRKTSRFTKQQQQEHHRRDTSLHTHPPPTINTLHITHNLVLVYSAAHHHRSSTSVNTYIYIYIATTITIILLSQ